MVHSSNYAISSPPPLEFTLQQPGFYNILLLNEDLWFFFIHLNMQRESLCVYTNWKRSENRYTHTHSSQACGCCHSPTAGQEVNLDWVCMYSLACQREAFHSYPISEPDWRTLVCAMFLKRSKEASTPWYAPDSRLKVSRHQSAPPSSSQPFPAQCPRLTTGGSEGCCWEDTEKGGTWGCLREGIKNMLGPITLCPPCPGELWGPVRKIFCVCRALLSQPLKALGCSARYFRASRFST